MKVKIFTASSHDPLNSGDILTSKIETWIADEYRAFRDIKISSISTSSNHYTIVTTITYAINYLTGSETLP
jgi:hypothetical protein